MDVPLGTSLRFDARQRRCRVILPPAASDGPSVLAFSHHKAGSTMLFGMLSAFSKAAGMTYVSVASELFARGVDLRSVEIEVDWSRKGYCFGGFRFFPEASLPLIAEARSALLVRDPRDAVVSHYFSVRDSHPHPARDGALRQRMIEDRERARATPIDDWVIENQGAAIESLASYIAQGFLRRPNVAIYRYEDVIYRKRAWADELLAWYGWKIPSVIVDRIVGEFDVFPKRVAADQHVRQVHPGNHRTILKPATREKLDVCFGHLLRVFGYIEAS